MPQRPSAPLPSTLLGLLAMALVLLGLGILPWGDAVLEPVQAEEMEEDGDADTEEGEGEDEEPIEGVDLGDKKVSFADKINKHIELGTEWLYNRPDEFEAKAGDVAHFGLIRGSRAYGGGQLQGLQYCHPTGPTALALYTLLKCGIDPKDPLIKKGFRWLRERHELTKKWDNIPGRGAIMHPLEFCSSYEISACILAVTALHDQYKKNSASRTARARGKLKIRNGKDKKWLVEMVETLVERRGNPSSTGERGWRYNNPSIPNVYTMNAPPEANEDLSSTQLAALALFTAHRFGVKVKPQIWMDIIEFTLDHQQKEGPKHKRYGTDTRYGDVFDNARGFEYIKGSTDAHHAGVTHSMTACGITNLILAREVLAGDKKGAKLLKNSGLLKDIEKGILDGLAWLDKHWSPFKNSGKVGYHIYYLYALERAMDVLEKKLVGSHLWYVEGAKEILGQAQQDSVEVKVGRNTELKPVKFWNTQSTHQPMDVLDTCFALLFLKRATKGILPGGPTVTGDYAD